MGSPSKSIRWSWSTSRWLPNFACEIQRTVLFRTELHHKKKRDKPFGLSLSSIPIEIAAYFFGAAAFAAASAYFFVKRSTRPAVSISFCLPVKNGWQFEQISTLISSPLEVERVSNVLPQAQCTFTAW